MTSAPLLIFGAGGGARDILWLARRCGRNVLGFVERDDHPKIGQHLNGVPLLSEADLAATHKRAAYIIGVGDPSTRKRLAVIADGLGLQAAEPLVSPEIHIDPSVQIGRGSVISSGATVTIDVTIGDHVHINHSCCVPHDVEIGDFATLSPGVILGGTVHVQPGAFLGLGAIVKNGSASAPMVIGEGAVVGAGAVVTANLPLGATVIGVPARPI